MYVWVCVCVCVCARVRVRVCVCLYLLQIVRDEICLGVNLGTERTTASDADQTSYILRGWGWGGGAGSAGGPHSGRIPILQTILQCI